MIVLVHRKLGLDIMCQSDRWSLSKLSHCFASGIHELSLSGERNRVTPENQSPVLEHILSFDEYVHILLCHGIRRIHWYDSNQDDKYDG